MACEMGWLYILSATGIGGILLISASFFAGLNCVKMSQRHKLNLFLHETLLFFALFYFLRQNEFVFLILGFALAAYAQVRQIRVKPYLREQ